MSGNKSGPYRRPFGKGPEKADAAKTISQEISGQFLVALQSGELKAIESFLLENPGMATYSLTEGPFEGSSALHLVLRPDYPANLATREMIAELLLRDHPELADGPDKFDVRPIHLAVQLQSYDLVQNLLARKADINSTDGQGNTPLHASIVGRIVPCPTQERIVPKPMEKEPQFSEVILNRELLTVQVSLREYFRTTANEDLRYLLRTIETMDQMLEGTSLKESMETDLINKNNLIATNDRFSLNDPIANIPTAEQLIADYASRIKEAYFGGGPDFNRSKEGSPLQDPAKIAESFKEKIAALRSQLVLPRSERDSTMATALPAQIKSLQLIWKTVIAGSKSKFGRKLRDILAMLMMHAYLRDQLPRYLADYLVHTNGIESYRPLVEKIGEMNLEMNFSDSKKVQELCREIVSKCGEKKTLVTTLLPRVSEPTTDLDQNVNVLEEELGIVTLSVLADHPAFDGDRSGFRALSEQLLSVSWIQALDLAWGLYGTDELIYRPSEIATKVQRLYQNEIDQGYDLLLIQTPGAFQIYADQFERNDAGLMYLLVNAFANQLVQPSEDEDEINALVGAFLQKYLPIDDGDVVESYRTGLNSEDNWYLISEEEYVLVATDAIANLVTRRQDAMDEGGYVNFELLRDYYTFLNATINNWLDGWNAYGWKTSDQLQALGDPEIRKHLRSLRTLSEFSREKEALASQTIATNRLFAATAEGQLQEYLSQQDSSDPKKSDVLARIFVASKETNLIRRVNIDWREIEALVLPGAVADGNGNDTYQTIRDRIRAYLFPDDRLPEIQALEDGDLVEIAQQYELAGVPSPTSDAALLRFAKMYRLRTEGLPDAKFPRPVEITTGDDRLLAFLGAVGLARPLADLPDERPVFLPLPARANLARALAVAQILSYHMTAASLIDPRDPTPRVALLWNAAIGSVLLRGELTNRIGLNNTSLRVFRDRIATLLAPDSSLPTPAISIPVANQRIFPPRLLATIRPNLIRWFGSTDLAAIWTVLGVNLDGVALGFPDDSAVRAFRAWSRTNRFDARGALQAKYLKAYTYYLQQMASRVIQITARAAVGNATAVSGELQRSMLKAGNIYPTFDQLLNAGVVNPTGNLEVPFLPREYGVEILEKNQQILEILENPLVDDGVNLGEINQKIANALMPLKFSLNTEKNIVAPRFYLGVTMMDSDRHPLVRLLQIRDRILYDSRETDLVYYGHQIPVRLDLVTQLHRIARSCHLLLAPIRERDDAIMDLLTMADLTKQLSEAYYQNIVTIDSRNDSIAVMRLTAEMAIVCAAAAKSYQANLVSSRRVADMITNQISITSILNTFLRNCGYTGYERQRIVTLASNPEGNRDTLIGLLAGAGGRVGTYEFGRGTPIVAANSRVDLDKGDLGDVSRVIREIRMGYRRYALVGAERRVALPTYLIERYNSLIRNVSLSNGHGYLPELLEGISLLHSFLRNSRYQLLTQVGLGFANFDDFAGFLFDDVAVKANAIPMIPQRSIPYLTASIDILQYIATRTWSILGAPVANLSQFSIVIGLPPNLVPAPLIPIPITVPLVSTAILAVLRVVSEIGRRFQFPGREQIRNAYFWAFPADDRTPDARAYYDRILLTVLLEIFDGVAVAVNNDLDVRYELDAWLQDETMDNVAFRFRNAGNVGGMVTIDYQTDPIAISNCLTEVSQILAKRAVVLAAANAQVPIVATPQTLAGPGYSPFQQLGTIIDGGPQNREQDREILALTAYEMTCQVLRQIVDAEFDNEPILADNVVTDDFKFAAQALLDLDVGANPSAGDYLLITRVVIGGVILGRHAVVVAPGAPTVVTGTRNIYWIHQLNLASSILRYVFAPDGALTLPQGFRNPAVGTLIHTKSALEIALGAFLKGDDDVDLQLIDTDPIMNPANFAAPPAIPPINLNIQLFINVATGILITPMPAGTNSQASAQQLVGLNRIITSQALYQTMAAAGSLDLINLDPYTLRQIIISASLKKSDAPLVFAPMEQGADPAEPRIDLGAIQLATSASTVVAITNTADPLDLNLMVNRVIDSVHFTLTNTIVPPVAINDPIDLAAYFPQVAPLLESFQKIAIIANTILGGQDNAQKYQIGARLWAIYQQYFRGEKIFFQEIAQALLPDSTELWVSIADAAILSGTANLNDLSKIIRTDQLPIYYSLDPIQAYQASGNPNSPLLPGLTNPQTRTISSILPYLLGYLTAVRDDGFLPQDLATELTNNALTQNSRDLLPGLAVPLNSSLKAVIYQPGFMEQSNLSIRAIEAATAQLDIGGPTTNDEIGWNARNARNRPRGTVIPPVVIATANRIKAATVSAIRVTELTVPNYIAPVVGRALAEIQSLPVDLYAHAAEEIQINEDDLAALRSVLPVGDLNDDADELIDQTIATNNENDPATRRENLQTLVSQLFQKDRTRTDITEILPNDLLSENNSWFDYLRVRSSQLRELSVELVNRERDSLVEWIRNPAGRIRSERLTRMYQIYLGEPEYQNRILALLQGMQATVKMVKLADERKAALDGDALREGDPGEIAKLLAEMVILYAADDTKSPVELDDLPEDAVMERIIRVVAEFARSKGRTADNEINPRLIYASYLLWKNRTKEEVLPASNLFRDTIANPFRSSQWYDSDQQYLSLLRKEHGERAKRPSKYSLDNVKRTFRTIQAILRLAIALQYQMIQEQYSDSAVPKLSGLTHLPQVLLSEEPDYYYDGYSFSTCLRRATEMRDLAERDDSGHQEIWDGLVQILQQWIRWTIRETVAIEYRPCLEDSARFGGDLLQFLKGWKSDEGEDLSLNEILGTIFSRYSIGKIGEEVFQKTALGIWANSELHSAWISDRDSEARAKAEATWLEYLDQSEPGWNPEWKEYPPLELPKSITEPISQFLEDAEPEFLDSKELGEQRIYGTMLQSYREIEEELEHYRETKKDLLELLETQGYYPIAQVVLPKIAQTYLRLYLRIASLRSCLEKLAQIGVPYSENPEINSAIAGGIRSTGVYLAHSESELSYISRYHNQIVDFLNLTSSYRILGSYRDDAKMLLANNLVSLPSLPAIPGTNVQTALDDLYREYRILDRSIYYPGDSRQCGSPMMLLNEDGKVNYHGLAISEPIPYLRRERCGAAPIPLTVGPRLESDVPQLTGARIGYLPGTPYRLAELAHAPLSIRNGLGYLTQYVKAKVILDLIGPDADPMHPLLAKAKTAAARLGGNIVTPELANTLVQTMLARQLDLIITDIVSESILTFAHRWISQHTGASMISNDQAIENIISRIGLAEGEDLNQQIQKSLLSLGNSSPQFQDFVADVIEPEINRFVEEYAPEKIQELLPLNLASDSIDLDQSRICYLADPEIIELLLRHDPSLEIRNQAGDTALHLAVSKYNQDAVRLILDRLPTGEEIEDLSDRTPYQLAKSKARYLFGIHGFRIRDRTDTVGRSLRHLVKAHQAALIAALDPAKYHNTIVANIAQSIPFVLVRYNHLLQACLVGKRSGWMAYDSKQIDQMIRFSGVSTKQIFAPSSNFQADQAVVTKYLEQTYLNAPEMIVPQLFGRIEQLLSSKKRVDPIAWRPFQGWFAPIPEFARTIFNAVDPNGDSYEKQLVVEAIGMYLTGPIRSMVVTYLFKNIQKLNQRRSLPISDTALAQQIMAMKDQNGRNLHQYLSKVLPGLAYQWFSSTFTDVYDTAQMIKSPLDLFRPIEQIAQQTNLTYLGSDAPILEEMRTYLIPFLINTYQQLINQLLLTIRTYHNYLITAKNTLEILVQITPKASTKAIRGSRPSTSTRQKQRLFQNSAYYQEDPDTKSFMDGI